MIWILWTLLTIYALWPLYVFVMAMLRAREAGTTTVAAWLLAFPLVIVAVVLDIALNYTLLALLTWDFPQSREITFSLRLERLAKRNDWRGTLARWLARSLLDPYDPSGKHIKDT